MISHLLLQQPEVILSHFTAIFPVEQKIELANCTIPKDHRALLKKYNKKEENREWMNKKKFSRILKKHNMMVARNLHS
jgi:tartrate dehydratase alpha subunit/fumarate hydratase class I-like protein